MSDAKLFLHQHKDFTELIRQIARSLKVAPYLIEKDYWLMHSLWALQQQGWQFELKGGTSLSKGYAIIDRFSEDIDIRFEPSADLDLKTGKNHDKPAHLAARKAFFDQLAEQITIPGIIQVRRDTDFDDDKLRNGGIILDYPSVTEQLPGVKEGILLEVGFDVTAPNSPCTISSWALDAALKAKVEIIDNRAVDVACYSPAYTFVEKLQTVSTKFRKQQETSTFPKNFMRHYYDIYCLLDNVQVQAFIGKAEYIAHKQARFPAADNQHIASNEAFLLSNPATRALYQREYEKTEALYYTGQIPFSEILARIHQHIEQL
ncbi:nucleotidyl transferase AbiEii/AbiGii toxin family protein [Methylotenera sp.]|uniref:nucleotidyl transferase AbiEii/AbiGii toxin family protein n=1 Tax=Methylotenera sp. TaxID=2051956 RepID=UPI002733E9C0|nr:nucleotidyl transferase AbiEii/AbiGii toxin family protein [Methylotenera sp.]MDP3308448.1 nucleotidyl transferase AbiEii/AbiGii toxin family protein [Methylotenera sp.]